jgi:hypothetical protein
MRYYLSPVRRTAIIFKKITNEEEDVEKGVRLYTVGGNVN